MKNDKKSRKIKLLSSNVFLSSAIGNTLEFYDFATYGFLMPIMAPLFFPATNPINSLLMACGVFAISFLARPIGGLVFGYIGDIYGRKIAFSYSLILMAITTALIGILPTYEKVGVLSPLLLICCRIMQGFCMGGEFSGSLIFAGEHMSQYYRGSAFITSSITAAGVGGWFLSSVVCSFSLSLNLHSLSWRIPFLLGAIVGIIGYYVRSTPESPVPLLGSFTCTWKIGKIGWLTAASVAGIGSLMGGIFYGLHIFPNSFLPAHFPSISHVRALQCTTIGIAAYMIFLPLIGWLSDYIKHTKIMQLFAFLTIIFSYPIIILLMTGNFFSIILSEILASFVLAGFMAPATYVMSQSFIPSIRYRLVSLSYNLGACLVGGLTPGIFLFLTENLNYLYGPGAYLAICGSIGLASSYFLDSQINNLHSPTANSPSITKTPHQQLVGLKRPY